MLLEKFNLPFETVSPKTDETPQPGEMPLDLVRRLALAKARAVSGKHPHAVVIGSDQVAACENRIVGKPGSVERAHEQLASFSGRTVLFLSAFAIVCEESGFLFERTVETVVIFRRLGSAEIDRYVSLDNPLDCAGSFRSEAAGTTLLKSMSSTDPTAIMGLPMIALAKGLRAAAYRLP